MPELLTVDEIARMCQVHAMTIRRHISQGRLRAVRVGKGVRVRKEDLDEYLLPVSTAEAKGRRKRGVIKTGDALFRLVGIGETKGGPPLSEDKYAAFPEALSPRR